MRKTKSSFETEALKLAEGMEKHIADYGLIRFFRVLRNQANNAYSNYQKGNVEKALSYLVIIELLCSIGIKHAIKEINK